MREFCPGLHTILMIGADHYQFLPHPLIPNEMQKIPRERATTYALMRVQDKTLWALKVPHKGSRDRRAAQVTTALSEYGYYPGLRAARRFCLTKALYSDLITLCPALEQAILMPWIAGTTWAGFMDDPHASASYTCEQALHLALTTAHVLWNMEMQHLAHTDIAGDNVVLLHFNHIELIDLEGCYLPGVPPPAQRSRGWQGYQHSHLDQRGNYRADGDRFAGAMLLTEMLTWWNSLLRAATPDEYDALFQQHHQEPAGTLELRLKIVRNTLWTISSSLCKLFDQAWSSPDLAQCPDFATWATCLLQVLN